MFSIVQDMLLLVGAIHLCLLTVNASPGTHIIKIGDNDSHNVEPDTTTASAGDIIEFRFFASNHSVARAEYGFPCEPYENNVQDGIGFFSGFQVVDKYSEGKIWKLKINDTKPIFFYCSQVDSCNVHQMVGVINPKNTGDLEVQKKQASRVSTVVQPGQSSVASTATSAAAAPVPHRPLATGAIVGIAIAGVAVLVLVAALFLYVGKFKTLRHEMKRNSATIHPRHSQMTPHPVSPPNSPGVQYSAIPYPNVADQYDTRSMPGVDGPSDLPKYTYQADQNLHLRGGMASPVSDASGWAPNRHSSLRSDPNCPQELPALDNR